MHWMLLSNLCGARFVWLIAFWCLIAKPQLVGWRSRPPARALARCRSRQPLSHHLPRHNRIGNYGARHAAENEREQVSGRAVNRFWGRDVQLQRTECTVVRADGVSPLEPIVLHAACRSARIAAGLSKYITVDTPRLSLPERGHGRSRDRSVKQVKLSMRAFCMGLPGVV